MEKKESVVLVTGAANGIGREIAKLYGELGANVILVDQDRKGGEKAAASLKEAGVNAVFIEGDVGEEATAIHVMDVNSRVSSGILIYLINNAGVSAFIPLLEMTTEQWDRIIHSNLRSVFLFAREGVEVDGVRMGVSSILHLQGPFNQNLIQKPMRRQKGELLP